MTGLRTLINRRTTVLVIVVVAALWEGLAGGSLNRGRFLGPGPGDRAASADGSALLAAAFRDRRSDLQVQGSGTVLHILSDDTQGSQHQRFILETSTGQTLLVAHNIDLAPRISTLARGDRVDFFGEYEWNDRGGVIHWTHHDPRGRHANGWLEHRGKRYE